MAAPHHGTGKIDARLGTAPSRGTLAYAVAFGAAIKRSSSNEDVAFSADTDRASDEADELVARTLGRGTRAGLIGPASPIHLARRYAGEANARSFRAP
jgi:hypothetical protein